MRHATRCGAVCNSELHFESCPPPNDRQTDPAVDPAPRRRSPRARRRRDPRPDRARRGGLNRLARPTCSTASGCARPAERGRLPGDQRRLPHGGRGRPHLQAGRQATRGTGCPAATRERPLRPHPRPRTSRCIVDVVAEFAEEVVRPAAAEANEACAAPEELLEATLEIGLPILGVPEELGGIAEERSAVTGALVPRRWPRATWGWPWPPSRPAPSPPRSRCGAPTSSSTTYLPAFTGDDVPAAALALAEPTALFDPLSPATTAVRTRRRLRAQRGEVRRGPRGARGRAVRRRRRARRRSPPLFLVESEAAGSPSRPTRPWACGRPASRGWSSRTCASAADRPARRRRRLDYAESCGSRGWPGARSRSAPARPCSTT